LVAGGHDVPSLSKAGARIEPISIIDAADDCSSRHVAERPPLESANREVSMGHTGTHRVGASNVTSTTGGTRWSTARTAEQVSSRPGPAPAIRLSENLMRGGRI
jgi:hypothetical protein